MGPVDFMMWRFRHAEGVMSYVKSWNLNECVLNINGKLIKITYYPDKELAKVKEDSPYALPIDVPFKEFEKTLTSMGYFKERSDNRHLLSYPAKEEPV